MVFTGKIRMVVYICMEMCKSCTDAIHTKTRDPQILRYEESCGKKTKYVYINDFGTAVYALLRNYMQNSN